MPHISSLYLFAKETDAPETVKGFKYQELITLEIWLSNKIRNKDEEIYCDYEEDIFQRDLKEFKATFTQLKLYSSKNFSFSSEEVIKALSHFFMLFVKGEYLLDNPIFVFETNSSIASKYKDNDAELLEEWHRNQLSMSDDLIQRCVAKLKIIIGDYIEKRYAKLRQNRASEKLDSAKAFYDDLPEAIWENFAKSIRWVFKGTDSDDALQYAVKNIKTLISKLPYPLSKDEQDRVFDKLRGVVSDSSMASEPEDRLLTNEMLTTAVLEMRGKDDKRYLRSYREWKDVEGISAFRMGEFYECLYAAKHCRRNKYLHEHSAMWLQLLLHYFNSNDIPKLQKREVLYEVVWLTLKPEIYKMPKNSLKGLERFIRKYFLELTQFPDINSLEDSLNLLSVIASSIKLGLIEIDEAEALHWHVIFKEFIEELIAKASNKDILLELLEIKAFLLLNFRNFEYIPEDESFKVIEDSFSAILENIPEASTYSVSQLGIRLDTIGELYFKFNINTAEEHLIEAFSEKLIPFVKERDSDTSAAKGYIEKGIRYMNGGGLKGMMKAMSFFHKGKDLTQNKDASEGYVLTLLSISEFYSTFNMNMAAKHYALCAAWYCINAGDSKLYKRISDSYAQIVRCDFKQGAWINALQNFESYIGIRRELDPDGFNPEDDGLLRMALFDVSYILAITPKFSAQLLGFIAHEKAKMGVLYTHLLEEYVAEVDRVLREDGTAVEEFVERKTSSAPISDIGKERIISWSALGSTWTIIFNNDFETNAIGEEFSALAQIFIIDILASGIDLHLLTSQIKITVVLSDEAKSPVQAANNMFHEWNIFVPVINSRDSKAINIHYAYISASLQVILRELSLLEHEKFDELFISLLAKDAAKKALVLNAHQIIYRKMFKESSFNDSQRQHFNSEVLTSEPVIIKGLKGPDGLSKLYNRKDTLDIIANRYKKTTRNLEKTLKRITGIALFQERVQNLRDQGWLDWQILLALQNHICNLKARNLMRINKKHYKSKDEEREDFLNIFHEIIRSKDENNTYVEIPLEHIIDEGLDMHMRQVPAYVLNSYGLEGKAKYPNFEAMHNLLNDRFNFSTDDHKELSPFTF